MSSRRKTNQSRSILKQGNSKTGRGSHTYSQLSIASCPGITPTCRQHCYTLKWGANFRWSEEPYALNLARSTKKDFVGKVVEEIRRWKVRKLRVHTAGDFYAEDNVRDWKEIASRSPNTIFWAYTRSWRNPSILAELSSLAELPNVRLWFSEDQDTGPSPSVPGVRPCYLQVRTDEEIPDHIGLLFRYRPRNGRLPVRKRVNNAVVCPQENGTPEGAALTCVECGICLSEPPVPGRLTLLSLPVVEPPEPEEGGQPPEVPGDGSPSGVGSGNGPPRDTPPPAGGDDDPPDGEPRRQVPIDTVHLPPEWEHLLPARTPEQRERLREEIALQGQLHPVVCDQRGRIIDGAETRKLCYELGYADLWIVMKPLDDAEARALRVALNVPRRKWRMRDKRLVAKSLLTAQPELTARRLASILDISPTTAANWKRELQEAGVIPVVDAVASDGRRFSGLLTKEGRARAAQRMLSTEPLLEGVELRTPRHYTRLQDQSRRAERAAQAEAVTTPPNIELIHCRFQDLADLRPDIVGRTRLILTDWPYHGGWLSNLPDVARFAERVLQPGGYLVALCGSMHLPTVHQELSQMLNYAWEGTVVYRRGQPIRLRDLSIYSRKNTFVVYRKGPPDLSRPVTMEDVIDVEPTGRGRRQVTEYHQYQQELMVIEKLLTSFAQRGDRVVDICGGGFTTAVAAYRQGCRFVGCDLDGQAVALGRVRLADAASGADSAA